MIARRHDRHHARRGPGSRGPARADKPARRRRHRARRPSRPTARWRRCLRPSAPDRAARSRACRARRRARRRSPPPGRRTRPRWRRSRAWRRSAWPTRRPANIGDEVAQGHGRQSITPDHVKASRAACRLAIATLAVASRRHAWRCHHPRRPDRRAGQLPLALRAAAGAALSRLSGRHLAGALRRRRSRTPRVRRETVLAALLFVLGFSTVFVALGASASVIGSLIRAYSGPLVDHRRHRHHRHGPALPRRHADRAAAPAEAAGGRQAGRAVGRLCDRAWPSPSAGRRASGRSSPPFWRWRRPSRR